MQVVITGIGVVTPLGSDLEAFWSALLRGESGLRPVESFDTSAYNVRLGGEVRDFAIDVADSNLDPSTMGRASQFAVAASRRALVDAGLEPHRLDAPRTGVSMGTTSGEPLEVERMNDELMAGRQASLGPALATRYPCHSIAAAIAADLGVAGPNTMIPTACAAGNYAAADAMDRLTRGEAEIILAGGADAFSRITYTGFARLGAIAPERCQPFDRNRKGMVPGEGAAVLVLEPAERARSRGARIYAELAGYGLSCDAHHMTGGHPDGDGAVRAMRSALAHSGIAAEKVDYISAHGTGTPTNDRTETLAAKTVFGEAARGLPMSSIKSMIGHTMGAASAIEAAVCALAIRDGRIPPTINYEEPDPECDLDYVTEGARDLSVGVAMSNAYAFGGNNASVILKRFG